MATVLLVDDDANVLETLALIVKSGGHDVITAGSGTAALGIVEGGCKLDLIVTDVVMPGVNGFNLARIARMRRRAMPILFISGFADYALTLRDPLDRYGKLLTKPITPGDLRREVEAALLA